MTHSTSFPVPDCLRSTRALQQAIREYAEDGRMDPDLCCAITCEPLVAAVKIGEHGKQIYSERAIMKWLGSHRTDPFTRAAIAPNDPPILRVPEATQAANLIRRGAANRHAADGNSAQAIRLRLLACFCSRLDAPQLAPPQLAPPQLAPRDTEFNEEFLGRALAAIQAFREIQAAAGALDGAGGPQPLLGHLRDAAQAWHERSGRMTAAAGMLATIAFFADRLPLDSTDVLDALINAAITLYLGHRTAQPGWRNTMAAGLFAAPLIAGGGTVGPLVGLVTGLALIGLAGWQRAVTPEL